ncbi:hypothetical protein [Paractinoplanes durhamensis]|uniref:Uncharacterized protein n=1 Tax=Paractinoplanes durhamensis TaxID=113563 RepID=A0ABQ3YVZ8_9ACTN|nr:hypothetical protein [Actinoplanes durhamensis]GIE01702.1 hypothetical protein Adu01nite_30520 [Actinoplanes durhamensis]
MSLIDLHSGFRDKDQRSLAQGVVMRWLNGEHDQAEGRTLVKLWWQLATNDQELTEADLDRDLSPVHRQAAQELITAIRQSPAAIDAWLDAAARQFPVPESTGHQARFGDRASFAVEAGEFQSPQLRVVDLWAGGERLTVDDNTAYLPVFIGFMRSTADQVRRRELQPCPFPGRSPEDNFRRLERAKPELRERFWFMQWGETVDNVAKYAYLDNDVLVIVFSFWREARGRTFVARIPPEEFVTTLVTAADLLAEGLA